MIRYILIISYLGDNYCGSQHQKDFPSVEKELSRCISTIIREPIKVKLCSRTDSGVHALRARAFFECNEVINQDTFLKSINSVLPDDIRVLQFFRENCDTGVVLKKRNKTYLYLIYNHKHYFPPYLKHRALWVKEFLDITLMSQANSYLIGNNNWEFFSATGSPRLSTIRNVVNIRILRKGFLIFIYIKGEGFLYKMVRLITGLLLEIGKGNISPNYVKEILAGKTYRRKVVPPYGLYLISN